MAPSTAWTRYPRTRTAFRGQGTSALTLRGVEERWVLLREGQELTLDVGPDARLESVISLVDFIFPPESWDLDSSGIWRRESWTCAETPDGWTVSGPQVQVKQRFLSADRARKWVDLRIDRPGGIRGPRTRGSTPAQRTLPDVRVTEAERADALALAARLNGSYASVVRASLKFVQRLVENGELRVSTSDRGEAVFDLAPRTGS